MTAFHPCESTMNDLPLAGLGKRLAALLYEFLLLLALLFVADYLFITLTRAFRPAHLWLQLWLLLVMAIYFSWSWAKGQTLAMKTWRLRVVSRRGVSPGVGRALLRFLFASGLFGISWLWAFVDPERQFLHDRLAGTRLINVSKK